MLCVLAILACIFIQYFVSPTWLRTDPSFSGECCPPTPGPPPPGTARPAPGPSVHTGAQQLPQHPVAAAQSEVCTPRPHRVVGAVGPAGGAVGPGPGATSECRRPGPHAAHCSAGPESASGPDAAAGLRPVLAILGHSPATVLSLGEGSGVSPPGPSSWPRSQWGSSQGQRPRRHLAGLEAEGAGASEGPGLAVAGPEGECCLV